MALEDISGYSLRRGLGSGSAGTVWLLRNLATGRHTVLKRIPKSAVAVKSAFLSDLELTCTIDHPHVARLLEVRESDREWLLFSQYVAAGTLTSLLERRGALSPGELVTLISPLAQALSTLHRAGITHGNLDLHNIMFDADGRPVITDTGLRTLSPPTPPEADLAALSTIAHQSGGTPKTFPPSLFTTSPDVLAHQALHQAHPLPIDLGFTKDPTPTPSTADPMPGVAEPTPGAAETTPGTTGPTPHASPATFHAATATAPSAFAAVRPTSADSPSPPISSHNPWPAYAGTPAAASATTSHTPAAMRQSLTRRRGRGRLARPTHRRRAGRQAKTLSPRQTASQAVLQVLRTRRAAYGILAACGAGAVTTLLIGLVTVGVLGHPATGSTATADQSTQPTSQATSTTPQRTPPPSAQPTQSAEGINWLQTLQALDVRRSHAFATLDPADLNAIYVPGSSPWSADRALLASYRDQHLRIEGLRLQIETVTIETPGPKTVVLRIVDRLVSGVAISTSGQRTEFPPGKPTARRITLTTDTTTWRISAITKA
ncbi:protein kinase [Streptomyces sp. SID13031]|uniref:serine/threonine protein kinase n=1 Tax=Streptomyces sp. SID13031 TaxID=2706046 RepID=UPI0013CD3D18|nr:protein kinase [Streptomyces sp. SID13031]NEA33627.1 protein kinase [Streptomyces sp. SID13031]